MTDLTLTGLYRYPVKSLGGTALDRVGVGRRGLRHDREWMVVDQAGRFLTQRQLPRMALIGTVFTDDGQLVLSAPGMPDHTVGQRSQGRCRVTVWRDEVDADYVDAAADAWLTDFLAADCRLVHMPLATTRQVDLDYAKAGDEVGFADGFPFLLISQASLDDLNRRLEQGLTMQRFRPNLVVSGCDPYAEDDWRRLRIGDLVLRVAKPCSRCIIPTIDPLTGERSAEPLKTLMGYRRRDNKVYFGQNLVHEGPGELVHGMTVEVLE